MSNPFPPLQIPHSRPPFPGNAPNRSLPPSTGWKEHRHYPPSLASSPPSSSSPPRTPSSSNSHNQAHICSSPTFDSDSRYNPSIDYIDELPPIWHHSTHLTQADKRPHAHIILPGLKDIFSDAALNTRSTLVNAPSIRSEPTRYSYMDVLPQQHQQQPFRYIPVFEEDDDEDGISLEEEHPRATRFRTSAERGQWKYDPIPFKPNQPPLSQRKSAPTCSPPPISGLFLPSRPISEPAPSFGRPSSSPVVSHSHEEVEEPHSASEVISNCTILSDQFSPVTDDTPCSLPSLTSDRESTEPEDLGLLSSPLLPPSSPPPLTSSPSASPMMRALSVDEDVVMQPDEIDMAPTTAPTPLPAPESSPFEDHHLPDQAVFARTRKSKQDPRDGSSPPSSGLGMEVLPYPSLSSPSSTLPFPSADVPSYDSSSPPGENVGAHPASVLPPASYESPESKQSVLAAAAAAMGTDALGTESGTTPPDVLDGVRDGHKVLAIAVDLRDDKSIDEGGNVEGMEGENLAGHVNDVGVDALILVPTSADVLSVRDSNIGVLKDKEKNRHESARDRPAKKLRLSEGPDGALLTGGDEFRKKVREAEAADEEVEKDEEEDDNKPVPLRSKRQKREKGDGLPLSSNKRSRHYRSISPSTSARRSEHKSSSTAVNSKGTPLPSHTGTSLQSYPKPIHEPAAAPSHDAETEALDAEICGMLIESMASSRASCLPASTLYKNVMQCHPSLSQQRSEREWMEVIERVLRDGEQGNKGGSGVFGKVESSFKDESGRPLEARWFYVPELDEDQERAALIRSMMTRPGKRSETKKYKQYYYRPLDKISRWDPEDEI